MEKFILTSKQLTIIDEELERQNDKLAIADIIIASKNQEIKELKAKLARYKRVFGNIF